MRTTSIISFLFLLGLSVYLMSFSTGCANIIPPSGGPRDSLPPRLLNATPKDSTLNFRGDRIVFNFDEYIDDPQDISNNILFTPLFEINPEISVRSRTVTVRFRDSLEANTTYILNFGNALRDINESNVIKNFVYTFSTGPALDSLTFSGKVDLAETGKTDSTLIIILHRNLEDSAVVKERPVYVSRVDAAGNFRFQNLPKDTFAIYALGNAGTVRRYQNPTQQFFAFSNEPVITGVTRDVTLHAYRVPPPVTTSQPTAQVRNNNPNERRLRFTTTPASGSLDLESDFVMTFPSPLRTFDSTLVSLSTDSSFTPVRYTVRLDSSRTALNFRSQWKEGTEYNLILGKDFAEDSAGRKLLKTDTLNFTTKKLSDYGQLRIRIRNLDTARKPVLQFLQGDRVVFSTSIKTGVFVSNRFNPGEYDLRILYDTNENGQWDPGQFFGTKRQPELTQPISRQLNVKPNFENEFDLSL
ncbi:MAG: hypothetical protein EOO10_00265 [Chitinophagaceae bacterium]|nr:MAG: hypothetical protein EOO10_00265 [Chitinophagaceae bacterium]